MDRRVDYKNLSNLMRGFAGTLSLEYRNDAHIPWQGLHCDASRCIGTGDFLSISRSLKVGHSGTKVISPR
jgi:hypothetical protein